MTGASRLIGRSAIVVALLAALVAVMTVPASARTGPSIKLARQATLVEGGQSVTIEGRASCPIGFDVLEAFVSINQDGNESDFGGFSIPCDGTRHPFSATVSSFDASFQAGRATGSAFLLVIDPVTQATDQAQDSRTLRLSS